MAVSTPPPPSTLDEAGAGARRRRTLELCQLTRCYPSPGGVVTALSEANAWFEGGTVTAVTGRSGSGKSTLLQLIGCLDRPTRGKVLLDGHDLTSLSEAERLHLRRTQLRFIFQAANLLDHLTAAENVALPLHYAGFSRRLQHEQALAALAQVGLQDRAGFLPTQLSGGEQQRVAIARALVPLLTLASPCSSVPPSRGLWGESLASDSPLASEASAARLAASEPQIIAPKRRRAVPLPTGARLVLADEPTGELDTQTAAEVLTLLRRLAYDHGAVVILATHDPVATGYADRCLFMEDGILRESG